jgi:regulator of replication initiation timing
MAMSEEKKETALRTLSKSLRKRFQGASVNISWVELDAFMMKAQTREMTNLINAYNEGYTDCKAGLPNKSENESNTNV